MEDNETRYIINKKCFYATLQDWNEVIENFINYYKSEYDPIKILKHTSVNKDTERFLFLHNGFFVYLELERVEPQPEYVEKSVQYSILQLFTGLYTNSNERSIALLNDINTNVNKWQEIYDVQMHLLKTELILETQGLGRPKKNSPSRSASKNKTRITDLDQAEHFDTIFRHAQKEYTKEELINLITKISN